jgi:FAD/FMN-containing dehydrogenase
MRFIESASLAVALFTGLSIQHVKPIPLESERILTPNSYTPAPGCKFLPSDIGWPSPEKWKSLRGAIPKRPGTQGPDYSLIAKTVEDVQNAVNFARENNVRLAIITTGHDFHGRETSRSGLSLDMSHFTDISLAPSWKCGDVIAPPKKCASEKEESMKMPGKYGRVRKFKRSTGHGPACDSYNIIKTVEGQQAVARIGAGVFNQMLTNAGDKSGVFGMGAQHGSVAVLGGWGQAAGHNPLANRYGLAVDQVLELEVVTADGKFVKASACSNPELYWALRGGGGSTYGVVTGGTVKLYKTPKMLVTRFFVNSTTVEGSAQAAAHFHKQGPTLMEKYGIQGYYYVLPKSFQGVLHQPDEFATLEQAKAGYGPLMAEMERLGGATHIAPKHYEYKTYKEFYDAEMGPMETEDDDDDDDSQTKSAASMSAMDQRYLSWYDGSDGSGPSADDVEHDPMIVAPYIAVSPQPVKKRDLSKRLVVPHKYTIPAYAQPNLDLVLPTRRTYLDSRLLPLEDIKTVNQDDLARAIKDTFPLGREPRVFGPVIRGFMIGGGKMHEPAHDALGVNPAWRGMFYHFIVNAVVGDARHDYNISAMANLFPKAGAYVNEASPHEPAWKDVYWGSNYPRLLEIKKKWDPKNVFWCSPCIGADYFTYDDERICPSGNMEFGTHEKPEKAPDTLIQLDTDSKVGLFGLPGGPGIDDPLVDWIESTGLKMTDIADASNAALAIQLKKSKRNAV